MLGCDMRVGLGGTGRESGDRESTNPCVYGAAKRKRSEAYNLLGYAVYDIQ